MGNLATFFASPERLEQRIIDKQSRYFSTDIIFTQILNYVPIMIMVLNEQRQLVFGNTAIAEFLHIADASDLLGKRPGEIFSCIHAYENKAGCGTSKFCRYCGAANAILSSQKSCDAVSECHIMTSHGDHDEPYDFRVWAKKFKETFTFFAIADIADEKRRLFLERIFLHDLANTSSSLVGLTELINQNSLTPQEKQRMFDRIKHLSQNLSDQITAHQQLVAAEYNQLKVEISTIDSLDFLQEIFIAYNDEEILNKRALVVDKKSERIIFNTDKSLLTRVIGNMIKNALEGSVPGETVTCGCYQKDQFVCIWVHNPAYIPENIRLQLFNRSFSTKGLGRGLGTYSMKYFTEKYLHGKVTFSTHELRGTRFTCCYPVNLNNA